MFPPFPILQSCPSLVFLHTAPRSSLSHWLNCLIRVLSHTKYFHMCPPHTFEREINPSRQRPRALRQRESLFFLDVLVTHGLNFPEGLCSLSLYFHSTCVSTSHFVKTPHHLSCPLSLSKPHLSCHTLEKCKKAARDNKEHLRLTCVAP